MLEALGVLEVPRALGVLGVHRVPEALRAPVALEVPKEHRDLLTGRHRVGRGARGRRCGTPDAPPPIPGRPPRLLTERDLLLVAQKLGSEWQEVGIACLGLPQSRLEQISEERPQRAVLRAFEMLREWRRRHQGGATAPRLLDCLRGAPVDPEVLELLQAM